MVDFFRRCGGQATVEYLVVGTVLIIVIAALAVLWRFCAENGLPNLIDVSASHSVTQIGGWTDALLY